VSGSAAGQSFVAAGVSDGGSTYYKGANQLVYQVNGTAAPEATLWTSLVSGFASSTTDFPKVTLAVAPPAGTASVWSSTIELLCASSAAQAAAGTSTIGAQDTIALPGAAGAMAYNAGTKKVYVALTTTTDAGLTAAGGIAVIDDTTNAVTGNVAATSSVVAMASNATTKTLYASEQTQVDVIDSTADTITTTVPFPSGHAEGFAVDETNNKVYVLGDSAVYVLDGATNTFGASPFAFTGMTPPTADFTGGKPAIAFDSATGTLYAMGLASSLDGVVLSINATTGATNQTYTLTSEQPNAIVFVPGVGAVVTTVSASGGGNAVLVGQTTPGALSFAPASLALCNTSVNVIGADATGLANVAAFLPTSGAIGSASAFDATELQENGEVPFGLLATGSSGTSCTFYGSYTYNYNALYSASSASPPASYVVKFSHQ
jgi:hypothetical protein